MMEAYSVYETIEESINDATLLYIVTATSKQYMKDPLSGQYTICDNKHAPTMPLLSYQVLKGQELANTGNC